MAAELPGKTICCRKISTLLRKLSEPVFPVLRLDTIQD
jgi:hypothetical protein